MALIVGLTDRLVARGNLASRVKVLFLKRLIPKWLRFAAPNPVNQLHPRLLIRSAH
jgi:hypothetical protein